MNILHNEKCTCCQCVSDVAPELEGTFCQSIMENGRIVWSMTVLDIFKMKSSWYVTVDMLAKYGDDEKVFQVYVWNNMVKNWRRRVQELYDANH